MSSVPGSVRSPGEGNGNPLQDSCLENPMNRGAWWATAHGVAESNTTEHAHTHTHHIFIYSSVNEHLGCFHVLAIVNTAAMNIEVHVCF